MTRELSTWQPERMSELKPGYGEPVDAPPPLRALLGVVRRNALLIAGCVTGAVLAGAAATRLITPAYEAVAAIQIDPQEGALPEVFKSVQTGNELGTGMEVLRSRTLAEAIVDSLGLRMELVAPRRVPRHTVLASVAVARSAATATYTLRRAADGGFAVLSGDSARRVGVARVGQPATVAGTSFVLAPGAAAYPEITLEVAGLDPTVDAVRSAVGVERSGREANIVRVSYEGSDAVLARDVVNALAARFVSRRHDLRKTEARSAAAFLQQQIDTITRELTGAEQALRRFREREHVVNPEIEGSTQVQRAAQLRAERSALDAERRALSEQMRELDELAKSQPAGGPSVYRRLLGFPTMLRNPAAASYLGALNAVEAERVTLLTRRTSQDPDVIRLTGRVQELEEQLRATATTYLTGLTNQVNALDLDLAQSGEQLATIPGKEVQFARLQREPKVLSEMVTLLQTRLKEAQIAQAMEDPSVQILDRAVAPERPTRPRPATDLALAGGLGLLIGMTAAFTRERLDRSVRSRADALLATGAPVLGIVPNFAAMRHELAGARGGPLALLAAARSTPRGVVAANGAAAAPRPLSVTEAYARVFMNIAWTAAGSGSTSLVITSPLPGDGKTTTAANLAITLAQRGYRVLLVDADMRRGQIGTLMQTSKSVGLSDLLGGAVGLEAAVQAISVGFGHTLPYITAGAQPPQPAALLQSRAMRALHEQFGRSYDVVIYDTPPLNAVSDAAILGTVADGVLMVARAGVTPAEALTLAAEQLRIARAPLHGVLLNDVDLKRDAAYDDAFRYYGRDDAYHDRPRA